MKNVKTVVKLQRLMKSGLVSLFILFLSIASTAFKSAGVNGNVKKADGDSSATDKSGFKSLFSASYYDPAKPYAVQLNPQAIPYVQNFVRSEGAELEKMRVWGKPYFDMYDGILTQYGLPNELKYLSVIESSLTANNVSVAGAVGPWQIMADEARRVGLSVNTRSDERTNFFKSTHAAARILKGLYSQFDDWLLVIAAYNCGAGRVRQAIRHSGSRNFWDLQAYLPQETRNHVKRFIGTHYIFEGNGGLTTMTAAELLDFDQNKARDKEDFKSADGIELIEVAGKFKSNVISKSVGIDQALFNKLNPNFDRQLARGASYKMRLPKDKMRVFNENRNAILYSSIQAFLNNQ